MEHGTSLITTLAASLTLATVMGLVANRLGLPTLVGYLLAGILLGPATPGFVADQALSSQLAEIGVILLMFGVGLHFSLEDLLRVKGIAVPGALLQIAVATAMGAGLATLWGWGWAAGLVFGLSLSVASTVVLLRALEQRGNLQSVNGQIAIGWLVVEDIAMVLTLVLLPALGGGAGLEPKVGGLAGSVVWTLVKVAVFAVLMLAVGSRVFPRLLWQVGGTGSRELFTLSVIAVAVGVAYGSARLFGVSFALGAFFAGMVMRESELSHRAAEESLPLRDAFSVLFFVSVGMLFDPGVILEHPGKLAAVLAVVVVGKSLAAFALVLAFRYPLNTALTVSASLAQIGEFSFILAAFGVSVGLLPEEGRSLVLAAALLSIAANSFVFEAIEPAQDWIRGRSELARRLETTADPLAQLPPSVQPTSVTGHVLLVGYGRVGATIGRELAGRGIPYVVAEVNRELVEDLRGSGVHAVAGDAAEPPVLIQAHVARARTLVIAAPDAPRARRMIETARMLNPKIQVVARTHSEEESALLKKAGADAVLLGEHELAHSMARRVLDPSV